MRRKKDKPIPINTMIDRADLGISIERIHFKDFDKQDKPLSYMHDAVKETHRHDAHSFFLLEEGNVTIEIDFKKYKIKPSSVIYIHPNQVHRTTSFTDVTVFSLAINNENINTEYLKLLEEITPVKPLLLKKETFLLLSEAIALCMKFSEQNNNKLHRLMLKDSCNALIALIISQYLEQSKSTDTFSRFDVVTKAFKKVLEENYITHKRPADYAQQLNISIPYLNECIKNTTGFSVSYNIQQRIVLEAKRLLYYSNKSVKEIAAMLGYDDYAYFSRLFTKIAGVSALTFRHKNLD